MIGETEGINQDEIEEVLLQNLRKNLTHFQINKIKLKEIE